MVQKKERTCESPRTEKELAGLKKKKSQCLQNTQQPRERLSIR